MEAATPHSSLSERQQSLQDTLLHLSPHGTYWLFAAVGFSSNIFYYFLMPETKGKTPVEVKQMFLK